MNRRRITLTLGAAAGGLLGAAVLPVAVAFADDYDIVPDPASTETVTGLYGLETAPPAVDLSFQGYQVFDVDNPTGTVVGTFDANESTASDIFGDTNEELLVTSTSGTTGTAAGDVPPIGSVLDTYTLGGDSGFDNVYSDLASTTPGGDVISDTLVTPFGDIAIPVTFDAAAVSASGALDTALADDYDFVPTSAETVTGISGVPPLDVAIQGTQPFDVGDAAGFDADVTTTSDAFGFSTEALLVTSTSGTAGSAVGDIPPVGSVFNTITFGDSGFENIYSDLASTASGGDVITDTLVTPFGDIAMPVTFDAAAQPADTLSYALGDGYDLVSASTETLTGINGVPPLDAAVQGTQVFDVDSSTGTMAGAFDADVSTATNPDGGIDEALLVTADLPGATGTVGTAAGDIPPVGSVFDIYNFGSGFETIYSDLASTTPGGDVISDTFVTPLGDFTIPLTFDAIAGLASDIFGSV